MGIIVEAIQSAIFWLLLTIDAIVYSFINWVYQVILLLAQGDIFRNSTVVDQLVNRIYIIIGVIVLFLVAYSLLKSMVNPDEGLKGKDSPVKIIQNVLISIVLIAIVPTVFDFAMEFQNSFLLNNTLGKIILGTGTVISPEGEEVVEIDSEDAIANGGMTMASTVFRAFFTPKQVEGENVCIGDPNLDSKGCTEVTINDVPYSTWWNNMINSNNFYMITQANDEVINDIDYRFIISTAAGIFVLIVLISYCIDLAVRMVKLALYQLIAPLPILLRIVPQDTAKKVFDNWIKATLSTYLEVFIRLGILYFVVLIINVFVTNVGTIFGTTVNNIGTVNPIIVLIAQALVILGIILFMKQAPQIIKELTGLDSGKYNVFGSAMRGLSTIGALGTGAVRGFTTGFDKNHMVSSIGKGAKNALLGGAKSFVGASQKEYKGVSDIRKNMNAAVNDVINKQRKKDSAKLSKKQELEEWREEHPNNHNIPNFLYKATSKVQKGAHDVRTEVIDWATSGGLDALKQKREQVAEVQKAMAQTVSMAKGEVEKNLKDYVNAQGVTLDRLQIDVNYFKAQLAGVKADDALTSKYTELQASLLNETDPNKQAEIRNQMAQIQSKIDRDVAAKRATASDQLKTAQDALDQGIKDATKMIIDYTYAGKNGEKVQINGQNWEVQTVAGLSAQIAKADNILKQNSSLMPDDLPPDGTVTITDINGHTEEVRSRDYKKLRNTLGGVVDELDADISKYVERKDKKEDK